MTQKVEMNRRKFLTGLLAAPAVITTPGLLMPVREFIHPETQEAILGVLGRQFGSDVLSYQQPPMKPKE